MNNAPKPNIEDLPTLPALRRSAIVAAIGAVAIVTMVYLPAEYGNDPTGVGSVLGLTEMGEIKQQLAKEAAEDAEAHGTDQSSQVLDNFFSLFITEAQAQESWKDEVSFTLEPGASAEIKVTMKKGASMVYSWVADSGRVNYDLHAHSGDKNVTYKKGRGETKGDGAIEAPFAGDHGWFWRNRDKATLTVTLRLRGEYSAIVRSE